VSEFVEECRREWRRLKVPRTIADEMADDLTADLQEAEADGASVEEVLGSGASDPRAFAAAWASERGIIRRRARRIPRPWLVASVALLVVVLAAGIAVVGLLAATGPSSPPHSTTVSPSIVFGGVIGTSVEDARVWPSGISLPWRRRTVLHRRPRSITVTFANTGARIVAPAHLTVQIDKHAYHFTARMTPNSRKSFRITLPPGLPRRFTIQAVTRPVPGESNTANNRVTWRVSVPS
jgi:hypothetical protein